MQSVVEQQAAKEGDFHESLLPFKSREENQLWSKLPVISVHMGLRGEGCARGSAGACAAPGTVSTRLQQHQLLLGFQFLNTEDHRHDKDPGFFKLQYLSVILIGILNKGEGQNRLETTLTGTNLRLLSVCFLNQWVEPTGLAGDQKKGSGPNCSILATNS